MRVQLHEPQGSDRTNGANSPVRGRSEVRSRGEAGGRVFGIGHVPGKRKELLAPTLRKAWTIVFQVPPKTRGDIILGEWLLNL